MNQQNLVSKDQILKREKFLGKIYILMKMVSEYPKNRRCIKKKMRITKIFILLVEALRLEVVVDQSETFSGILEENHKNINIHNASVMGSNIENNFYIIKNKIKKKS